MNPTTLYVLVAVFILARIASYRLSIQVYNWIRGYNQKKLAGAIVLSMLIDVIMLLVIVLTR